MNPSSQLKIFVVDDEIFYLNILKQHICNLGYEEVITFQSGTDCLDRLSEKPDVIFLDYNMDILSGYEILKKIKRFDPNIYVVMISGQEEIKPVIDTLKHGAFDYIKKGDVEEEKIKIVLESVLEVKDLLERSKPNLLKKLFEFL